METSSKKVRGNNVAFSTFEITLTKVRGNNVDFSTFQITSKRVRGNNIDFSTSKISLKKVQGNNVDFPFSEITSKKRGVPVARETCNICHYVLVITLFKQVPDNNSLKKIIAAIFAPFWHHLLL